MTYIITGGSINKDFVKKVLETKGTDCLIAADKGLDTCIALGLTPDYVIGDFDSVSQTSESFLHDYKGELVRLNPIKDDTDTEAALGLAFERTTGEIVLLGATGTRVDHLLANIYLLGQGLKRGRSITLLDEHNRIRMIDDKLEISKEKQFGNYVSVLPIGGSAKGVCLEGFYYPLENATIETYSSLGVSNEIVAETGRISVGDGVLLVIESSDGNCWFANK